MFFILLTLPAVVVIGLSLYCKFSMGKCTSQRRLDGKVIIVTGSNSGIGYETAKQLAARGGKVILACRNLERGQQAGENIKQEIGNSAQVRVKKLDLTSFKSVREFCKEILQEESRLDILINNAAGTRTEKVLSTDGIEEIFAGNHFGPFLLTNLLLGFMLRTSDDPRIINVSSGAHNFVRTLDFDNLNSDKSWAPFAVYSRTKLANILFTKELHRRIWSNEETKGRITINALNPGAVKTDAARNVFGNTKFMRCVRAVLFALFFKSVEEGVQTTIHLAVSEDARGMSGLYWEDCQPKSVSRLAQDPILSRKLWEVSAKIVGLKPEDVPQVGM